MDASSTGSGNVEVTHQCRPHRKGEVEVLPWLITTGTPSVRRCTKASKEKTGGELSDAYKNMSRAVGVKKPQEAQKVKVLWKMKAAKDAGEEYNDPQGINETRLALWDEHLKDPIVALDKALKCVEILY